MNRCARLAGAALVTVLVGAGAVIGAGPAMATRGTEDPPLTVPEDALDAALHCSPPFDDTREPVLLVHGTFTNDDENYGWNHRPALIAAGFDVCSVTLPGRSLGDIQVSSEYVVHAVREMAAASGRAVDLLGHSQGGLQPRWLTRFYPATRALVDDVVTLAAPHQGTALASLPGLGCAACFQMGPDSAFIERLNSGDETPGDVDYTSIFTELADELVIPEPAASTLDGGGDNVANISIQAACAPTPKLVDHVSIAADTAVRDLVLDAFTQEGPADVDRAEPDCVTPFFPTPEEFAQGSAALENLLTNPTVPAGEVVLAEPPTAFYARDGLPTFADVPAPHWAHWEVEWAAATGVATGTDGTFSPAAPWKRAQAVMWLWRLAGSPAGSPDTSFSDVPAGAWYHDGLDWAVEAGVVDGFPDGTFRPSLPVNRGQTAAWLWAHAGEPAGSAAHGFTDVGTGAWYGDGLDWVAAEGIVDGHPDGTYRPRADSTRAQAARMLFRLARATA